MGWLDFFRKNDKKEVRTVPVKELDSSVLKELEKVELRIEEIRKEIKVKVNNFAIELKKHIEILTAIELEDRKEYEKIKLITLENLKNYINHLKNLLSRFEEKELGVEGYFTEINSYINVFRKNSRKSLGKATILIGKQIEQVEVLIKSFYQEVNNIFQENIGSIEKMKKIKEIQKLKASLGEAKRVEEEIENNISSLNEKRETFLKEKNEREKALCLFKESPAFKEFLERKERIRSESEKLREDVDKIKERIDLKSLLKQFHEIEKKRELIKDYRKNFLSSLEEDEGLVIIEMVGSNLEDWIKEEIMRIREKSLQLKKDNESGIIEKKENSFHEKIREIDFSIRVAVNLLEEENKKKKKFDSRIDFLQNEILEGSKRILGVLKL